MARAQVLQKDVTGMTKRADAGATTTVDHDEIRNWVEARRGKPAKVSGAGDRKGKGILRIDFNEPEARLIQIGWDEFFEIFESQELAFLREEETSDGKLSNFNKFVSRD